MLMNTNRKILLIVTLMLIALTAATIINVGLNFRDYAYNNAIEKSKMTAEIVRDGLTAHMVNGIMDKRDFFLRNIAMAKDVESLWVVRSEKVTKQFGEGLNNENPRDEIDKRVLASGKEYREIIETTEEAKLRVTIPYIATAYSSPNCLECHDEPHTAFKDNASCMVCHPVHSPLEIVYGDNIVNETCGSCHKGVAKKLREGTMKHATLYCVYCHADRHRNVPECQKCHEQPHSKGLLSKFNSCADCHGDPHVLKLSN